MTPSGSWGNQPIAQDAPFFGGMQSQSQARVMASNGGGSGAPVMRQNSDPAQGQGGGGGPQMPSGFQFGNTQFTPPMQGSPQGTAAGATPMQGQGMPNQGMQQPNQQQMMQMMMRRRMMGQQQNPQGQMQGQPMGQGMPPQGQGQMGSPQQMMLQRLRMRNNPMANASTGQPAAAPSPTTYTGQPSVVNNSSY